MYINADEPSPFISQIPLCCNYVLLTVTPETFPFVCLLFPRVGRHIADVFPLFQNAETQMLRMPCGGILNYSHFSYDPFPLIPILARIHI